MKSLVSIFSVHGCAISTRILSTPAGQAYTKPLRQLITPEAEAFFIRKLDLARLSSVDRMITKLVVGDAGPNAGDFQEWDKINGWAQKERRPA